MRQVKAVPSSENYPIFGEIENSPLPGMIYKNLGWREKHDFRVGQNLRFPPRPEDLFIEELKATEGRLEFRLVGPKGRRIYLKYSRHCDCLEVTAPFNSNVELNEVELNRLTGRKIRERIGGLVFEGNSLEQTAEIRARSQEAVFSLRHPRTEMTRLILENVKAANHYLLKLDRKLKRDDLEEVNRLITAGALTPPEIAGVTRGTKKVVLFKGEEVLVDLTESTIFGRMDEEIQWQFTPSEQVPAKLDTIVSQLNWLDLDSPLSAALAIYQSIVFSQPFVDGHKRMARVLVDFALRKIGAPPFPHQAYDRNPFYTSEEELEELYRRHYGLPVP